MRICIILISLFFLLISCRKDIPESDKFGYDIVLIMGQSNTHYGYSTPKLSKNLDSGIVQVGRFDGHNLEIITAQAPLDHHSKKENRMGFGMVFAELYRERHHEKNRPLLLIPCGKTGSAFMKGNWKRGDDYYSDALMRAKFILERYPASKLKAILWHQGESDLGNPTYENELDEFIKDFRTDLHLQNLPIILGGMVPYWAESSQGNLEIQNIIKDTPNRVPFTGYVNPTVPFRIEKEHDTVDQIHYDIHGQIELGKRYFNEYEKLN